MSIQKVKNNIESFQKTAQLLKSSRNVNKMKESQQICGANYEKRVLKLKSLNCQSIQSRKDVFYEIKQVIQMILSEVNKTIEYKKGYYNLCVSKTVGVIFNEPQIMFTSSSMTSRQGQPSRLVCYQEPKPKIYIDGSIGCVRIQNKDKERDESFGNGRLKNRKLTNRSSRRMSKSGFPVILRSSRNSIKFRTMESLNLQSIEQKKSNFSVSKSINISVNDFMKNDLEETADVEKNKSIFNSNKRKSMSSGEFLSLMRALSKPSKFTAISTENEKDDDDNLISYLRYVKQENENTGSNVINYIFDAFKPKQEKKDGGKRKSIINYKFPKIDKLDEKQWMQGPDETYEAMKGQQLFLLAKKQKKMSVRVSLLNKEQINKDINSVKDKFILINTQAKQQERKLSRLENKQNFDLLKQLEANQQLNKNQEERKSFMGQKDESLVALKNEKQIVRFPSLNTRRQSKQLFHPICIDQSLIWLKGKEDQKEYEERMSQFMAKNSQKCTLRVNTKQRTEGTNETKEKRASINIPQQINNPRKSRISRLSLLIAR